jgi:hypothetical protein
MATRKTSTKKATKAASTAAAKAPKPAKTTGKAAKATSRAAKPAGMGGARKPGLHALIGRAVADEDFLDELLRAPEATLSGFNLDVATRRDVLELLANPKEVRRNVSAFVKRFRRRPSAEAV